MNLSISLDVAISAALSTSAIRVGLEPSAHATRIIEDYLMGQDGLLSEETKRTTLLARSLIERAVEGARAVFGRVESSGIPTAAVF